VARIEGKLCNGSCLVRGPALALGSLVMLTFPRWGYVVPNPIVAALGRGSIRDGSQPRQRRARRH